MSNKLVLTQRIREIYSAKGNLMAFLREQGAANSNSVEDIMIAYDFQAGSYIAAYETDASYLERYTRELAGVLRGLGPFDSILEAGVGEATTLTVLAKQFEQSAAWHGFDVSWSRVRLGKDFAGKHRIGADLFCGDLFNIPLADGSMDVVYTSHSIEPNGGREREAIRELARVAGKWLVLLEPAHEFAPPEARARMEKHGYIRGLPEAIQAEGLELVEHRLFPVCVNPLNPTGLYVIRIPTKKPGGGGVHVPHFQDAVDSGGRRVFLPRLAPGVSGARRCALPAACKRHPRHQVSFAN